MPDYQNGKIYCITFTDGRKYIGSTAVDLEKRFIGHKAEYNRYKKGKLNKVSIFRIFDEIGTNGCTISLIEPYPCKTRQELNKREGEIIQSMECVNKVIAGRSKYDGALARKQRTPSEVWKAKRAEYDRVFRERNLEKRKEQVRNSVHKWRMKKLENTANTDTVAK
jgi:hypothetical protein